MPQALAAAIVAALSITGTAAVIATAVLTVAITVGTSLLLGSVFGPNRPKPSDGQQNVKVAVGSRRRHYGIVHTGGQETFYESAAGTLAKVITLGTGEEGEIIEHRINDKPVTVVAGTITEASFHGAVHIYTRSGTDDQTAIGELTAKFAQWTGDHRQRGCAHAAIVCDPVKQKFFSEVFNGQVPQYTQVRKGVKVYDPRTATTVWSDNAALVIADYFAHPDGYGAGSANVNWANIGTEADFCDQTVTTVNAEVIARWRLWASYSLATDERRQVLTDMLAACDGFCWQDADGKFNLMTGRYETPTVTITDDHIVGMTASLGPNTRHRVSAAKVLYTEAAIGYREQESATVTAGGSAEDPNTDPQVVQLYFSPHHNQAVRVGKIVLTQLGERWRVTSQLNLYGLNLLGARFCRFESAQLGIAVDMKIDGLRLDLVGCTVEATFAEVKAEDWTFNAATEEGTPPNAPDGFTPPPPLAPPTELALSAVQIVLSQGNGVAIEATWNDPGRADLVFEVQVRPSAGGTWVAVPVDQDMRTARTGAVNSGTQYEVQVRSVTILGQTSAWSASVTIVPVASAFLGPPSALAATGGVGQATVTFRMPTEPTLAYARLYRNTTNAFGGATQVGGNIVGGLGEVMTIVDTGLAAGVKYYWARAFDGGGGQSTLAGPVTATVT